MTKCERTILSWEVARYFSAEINRVEENKNIIWNVVQHRLFISLPLNFYMKWACCFWLTCLAQFSRPGLTTIGSRIRRSRRWNTGLQWVWRWNWEFIDDRQYSQSWYRQGRGQSRGRTTEVACGTRYGPQTAPPGIFTASWPTPAS